ncbi:MAG: spore protease YyaC [Peptococcaceae bacterium]|nr:MAG: spore protease YyaC [Peptococcaceae bacterium]
MMTTINQVEVSIAPPKTKIHSADPLAVAKFSWDFMLRLEQHGVKNATPKILLCIGTDRSTGDCLGPLIGTKISNTKQNFFTVYGTLDHPVHASNLQEKLKEISHLYHKPFIIAIDACLGELENIGCISLGNGSLQPGAGVNKALPSVGNIHITGTVNVGGFMEYVVLQNTRLNLVMRIANIIAEGLSTAISGYQKQIAQGY